MTPEKRRRQARLAGGTIAGTMILWMALQLAGARLGIPTRWVVLGDLVALAAFFFALVVTIRLWRG